MIKAKGKVVQKPIIDVFRGKKVLYKNYITNISGYELKEGIIEGDSNNIDTVEKIYVNCWWDKNSDDSDKTRYIIEVNKKDLYELMFNITKVTYQTTKENVAFCYPVKWTQWGKCFKNKEVDTGKIVLADIDRVKDSEFYIAKMIPFSKKEYSEEDMLEFVKYALGNFTLKGIENIFEVFKTWKMYERK